MATTITANGINFPDGSASAPSIGGTDTNTGLFTGSDIVGFATGGVERIRIDANGNLSLGTTSPNSYTDQRVLTINGTTYGRLDLEVSGTLRGSIWANSGGLGIDAGANDIEFFAGSSERLRIDSGGRILIGSTQLLDNTAGTIHIDGGTSGGRIALRGTTTSAGGGIGEIFSYWNTNKVAGIIALAGHDANNKDNGHLTFYTRPDLATGVQERVRIDSSGNLIVNKNNARTHAVIILSKADAGYAKLEFDVGTSQKAYVELDAAENLVHYGAAGVNQQFYTDANERLRIDTTGHLHIKGQDHEVRWYRDDGNRYGAITYDGGNFNIRNPVNDHTRICKSDGTEIVKFNNNKNVYIADGDLVISTAGHGIDFSATSGTGTSELLDDYEEGSWTGTVDFGGGTTGITYSARQGRYTKIGRLVHASFVITLSNKGSSNGNTTISGLPFTATNDSDDRINGTISLYGSMYNITSNIMAYNTTNQTSFYLYDGNATTNTALTDSNWSNSGHIRGFVLYHCS